MTWTHGRRSWPIFLLLSLYLSSPLSSLSVGVSEKVETVVIPLSKLREWQNSLTISAQHSAALASTIVKLRTQFENSKQTVQKVEGLLLTLQQLSANSQLLIEKLLIDLETSKVSYQELLVLYQALQETSDRLLTEMDQMKNRRLRDIIITALAGAAVGGGATLAATSGP